MAFGTLNKLGHAFGSMVIRKRAADLTEPGSGRSPKRLKPVLPMTPPPLDMETIKEAKVKTEPTDDWDVNGSSGSEVDGDEYDDTDEERGEGENEEEEEEEEGEEEEEEDDDDYDSGEAAWSWPPAGQLVLPSIEESPAPDVDTVLFTVAHGTTPRWNPSRFAEGNEDRAKDVPENLAETRTHDPDVPRLVTPRTPDGDVKPEACPRVTYSVWVTPVKILKKYEKAKKASKGSAEWTDTESSLHRLLGLRGTHPLMPGAWKRDFLGINMDDLLFSPVYDDNSVVLRSLSKGLNAQFRATKALLRIFSLSATVSDLRTEGEPQKASDRIKQEICRYVAWARKDAGLDRLEYAPNIGVYQLGTGSRSDNLADDLDKRLSDWATEYRQWFVDAGIEKAPRTLFALVIMQHIVMVLTIDAEKPNAAARCFAELDMSRSDGQWLDQALNLVVPIHMARDTIMLIKHKFTPTQTGDDDPDA